MRRVRQYVGIGTSSSAIATRCMGQVAMASNDSRRLRFCYLATFSVTPHMREEESKERQRRRLTGPPVDLLLSMRIRNVRPLD